MILTFKDSTLRSLFLVLLNDVKYFKHGASSPVSLFSLFRSSASLRWVCPHMCSRYELYHTRGLMVILPMCSRYELHTWAPRHPARVLQCHTHGLLVILPMCSRVTYMGSSSPCPCVPVSYIWTTRHPARVITCHIQFYLHNTSLLTAHND